MNVIKSENNHNIHMKDQKINIITVNKFQLLFMGMIYIGFLGYLIFRSHWIGLVFGHTAAIGIMGFYGCLSGAIANYKGRSYHKAFKFGFFLPIILGFASLVVLATEEKILNCGGWASLATGMIVVIFYSLTRKRVNVDQI